MTAATSGAGEPRWVDLQPLRVHGASISLGFSPGGWPLPPPWDRQEPGRKLPDCANFPCLQKSRK